MSLSFRDLVFGKLAAAAAAAKKEEATFANAASEDNSLSAATTSGGEGIKSETQDDIKHAQKSKGDKKETTTLKTKQKSAKSNKKNEKSSKSPKNKKTRNIPSAEPENDNDDNNKSVLSLSEQSNASVEDDDERTTASAQVNFKRLQDSTVRRLEALYGLWDREAAVMAAEETLKFRAATKQEGTEPSMAVGSNEEDTREEMELTSPANPPSQHEAGLVPMHPMALLNPHIPSAQLPHYRPPPKPKQKQKRRRRKRRDGDLSSEEEDDDKFKEEEKEELTEEEKRRAEKRRKRKHLQYVRQQEWNEIRRNWRKRKVDLRKEVDVGGAILAAVSNNYRPEIHSPLKQKSLDKPSVELDEAGSEKNISEAENEDEKPSIKEEDKEEEEEDVHGQVLKRLFREEKAKPTEEEEESEPEQPEKFEPYRNRLDYWELGKSYPKIDASLYKPAALPKIRPSTDSSQRNTCDQDKYPGLKTKWSLSYRCPNRMETRNYTARLLPASSTLRPRYQHQRQMFRLAARYLVGSPPRDTSKQLAIGNRILRSLLNPSMLQASWQSMKDRRARSCGMRLVRFLESRVDNPSEIMEKLEIHRDVGLLGLRSSEDSLRTRTHQFYSTSQRRGESLMQTSCNYAAVPGTCPPTPQYPLSSLGVEFGLADRFSCVWHKEKIPVEAITLNLSTIFARWLSLAGDEHDRRRAELEHQMSTLMEHAVRLNDDTLQKGLAWRKHPADELPTFQLYRSMMAFSSLMANNGGHAFASFSGTAASRVGQHKGLYAAAHQLFDFLEQSIRLQGLNFFPQIHLVFALLRISTGLPEEAVSIISSSTSGESQATPYSIIRDLLEYLEGEGLLVEFSSHEGGVEVGKLEYLFFLASESVLKCIEADPIEPDYHSWYIAIKAASLLLCSGNRIGGGASLFPSASKKKDSNALLMETFGMAESREVDHEIRAKLHKFDETRYETAKAFQLLLNLNKIQDSSRCHYAVASFLEWRQVVALLVGDLVDKDSHFTEIREHHEKSSRRWASLDGSSAAAEYLKRKDDAQHVLYRLADSLEQMPDDIVVWRRLVRALGAVQTGNTSDTAPQPMCPKSEPSFETEEHSVPSDNDDDDTDIGVSRSKSGEKAQNIPHWVRQRLSWWSHGFLHVSVPAPGRGQKRCSTSGLPRELYALKCQMKSILDIVIPGKSGGFPDTEDQPSTHNDEEWEWLEACLGEKPGKTKASPTERSRKYDHLLPQSIKDTLAEPPEVDYDSLGRPFGLLKDVSVKVEATCYKILLRRHIYGPSDKVIADTVKCLICTLWDPKTKSLTSSHEHMTALQWMHSMGIDVLSVIPDVDPPDERPKEEIDWPHEMRRVVLEHVDKHGAASWKSLMDNHPAIFAGTHRMKARQCYLFLQRKGMIPQGV